jgi:transposase
VTDPRDLRIAELEAQLAEKDAQLAARDARIAELESKVAELTELVMSLKQQLERNSRNSHLPPSSDGPGGRSSPEKPRTEGARKHGGQPGHSGSKRELLATPLGRAPRA